MKTYQHCLPYILISLLILSYIPIAGSTIQTAQNRTDVYYVDGTGPGNYSTIPSAINATQENSIIYVYDESSPYTKHIHINNF